jgi:hypothetical protein
MTEVDDKQWWEVDIDRTKPVAEWTLEQCDAYVTGTDEGYGEQYAEAGSGAMSLGYGVDGAYAAANAVPHPNSDPIYVAARERVEASARAYYEAKRLIQITRWPKLDEGIPF